ncbi:MAG TPA: hypothetical protein EYN36_05255 [Pelagibacteraceae bacterium]|nr:hypothetical protein [Pelagibacteraceae bacterium]
MKYLILLILSLLVFACSNGKRVYWCGDHACINNKEKEAYFKKTMIVEIRELSKQNKKSKSELEIIKKQAGLEQKKEIKNEKELAKQVRLDKKRRIKEEKELAKQVRLDKKRRIKEEKELAKQVRLEEKKIIKEEKKSYKKKILKTENVPLEKEIVINTAIARINIYSNEFKELVEKITNKNMFRPYPNINDIPN